jgi:hypothetical protein
MVRHERTQAACNTRELRDDEPPARRDDPFRSSELRRGRLRKTARGSGRGSARRLPERVGRAAWVRARPKRRRPFRNLPPLLGSRREATRRADHLGRSRRLSDWGDGVRPLLPCRGRIAVAYAALRDQPECGPGDSLRLGLRSGPGGFPLVRVGRLRRSGVRAATHRPTGQEGVRAHPPALGTWRSGGLPRVARRSRNATAL